MSSFRQFFDIQLAIFRRVRCSLSVDLCKRQIVDSPVHAVHSGTAKAMDQHYKHYIDGCGPHKLHTVAGSHASWPTHRAIFSYILVHYYMTSFGDDDGGHV